MTTLNALLAQTLADPGQHARAHCAAGGRAIGFVGADVPVELVLAANAFPLSLNAIPGRPTERADVYLEPSFAPVERSIAEQWICGDLSFLSGILLSRARDSSQRLYYYMRELQHRGLCPGPPPILYDVAKINRVTSQEYTLAATRRLAEMLGSDLKKLPACVQIRDRRRHLLNDLQRLRNSGKPPAGSFVERLMRASDQCDATRFDEYLAQWITVTASSDACVPTVRIALAGSMPPDDRLHLAVESAGGTVVFEYGDHTTSRLGDPISSPAEPLESLSAHYQQLRYGPRMFGDRAIELLNAVHTSRAQAVILWLLEEEEALIWDLPGQLQALTAASIPTLVLTRRRWDTADDSLDRIRAFVRAQEASR